MSNSNNNNKPKASSFNGKQSASAVMTNKDKPKERKSVEDTVTSLRQELHVLYESLKDKNEQLLCLEKDVRDRDITIKYLKCEYKKLNDSASTKPGSSCSKCGKKVLSGEPNGSESGKDKCDGQPDEILCKMQKDLKDREHLIKELNKKIIRLSDNMIFVQKESLSKDDRIEEMQNEVDKYRQVVNKMNLSACSNESSFDSSSFKVRPFTKAVMEQRKVEDDFFLDLGPGLENTRVLPTTETIRLKRTAISAEPLSQLSGAQNDLVKIPKTSL